MTLKNRKQIQFIIADLDYQYKSKMMASTKEEELFEKKHDISDWIYCLYANDEKAENENHDYKDSLDWLVEQFYQSKENISFWDKNWVFDKNATVYAKRYGKFYISKSGQYKLVSPEDFISSSDNTNQHSYVDLKIKRFEISDNSWFYFRGNKYLGTAFLTRIYFNFNYDFENIVSFSKDLCTELNAWGISFEYKFATKKTQRFDKGVLYTTREHYFVVFYLVSKLASDKKYDSLFGEEILAFTKKTTLKGVSFGEEPPVKNTSFGRYRSDIMADIYIDYYNNINKIKDKLENFIFKKLLETGFSTKDFFRNPNSYYPYDFSIFSKKFNANKKPSPELPDKYLTWALNTGRLICKQAIIINQKGKTNCYWLSTIEDEIQHTEYRLTDNSFYEGRLGIIYFLAKLFVYFPDEYLFKVISEIVIKNILAEKPIADESGILSIISQIKSFLKLDTPKKSGKHADFGENIALVDEINTILRETTGYSALNNEAPQPIIHNGYSAIGLILLAMHEHSTHDFKRFKVHYAKESLLKIINHVLF